MRSNLFLYFCNDNFFQYMEKYIKNYSFGENMLCHFILILVKKISKPKVSIFLKNILSSMELYNEEFT